MLSVLGVPELKNSESSLKNQQQNLVPNNFIVLLYCFRITNFSSKFQNFTGQSWPIYRSVSWRWTHRDFPICPSNPGFGSPIRSSGWWCPNARRSGWPKSGRFLNFVLVKSLKSLNFKNSPPSPIRASSSDSASSPFTGLGACGSFEMHRSKRLPMIGERRFWKIKTLLFKNRKNLIFKLLLLQWFFQGHEKSVDDILGIRVEHQVNRQGLAHRFGNSMDVSE